METGGILEEAKKGSFHPASYDDWYNKAKPSLIDLDTTNNNNLWKVLYTEKDVGEWVNEIRRRMPIYNGWKIAQLISGKSTEDIRGNLLAALNEGQDTLSFSLLKEWTWKDLQRLLERIPVKNYPFFLQSEELTIPLYLFFNRWMVEAGFKGEDLSGFIGTDPLAEIVLKGYTPKEADDYYDYWCDGVLFANENLPKVKTIFINGTLYEQAGGSAIEQLAFILLTGVEHLERLKQKGLSEEEIFTKIVVGISITSDFFTEIAKIRALRYLWGKLVEAYKLPPEKFPVSIYAETTITNKTTIETYNNLLRTGGEALAATIGQVDWLRVHPFDITDEEEASSLAIRIARNTHHILREESHMNLVTDPAGGSYFLEALTKELIEKTWALFLQGDEAGGMFNWLIKGTVQKKLVASAKQKIEAYKNGSLAILGVHIYPEENSVAAPSKKNMTTILKKAKMPDIETLKRELEAMPAFRDFIMPAEITNEAIPSLSLDWWKMAIAGKAWDEK